MHERINKRLLETIIPGEQPLEICDPDLKGFILRVQPSGHMTYYARYRLADGRQNRIKLGTADKLSPTQARDLAKAALAKVVQGVDPAEEKKRAKPHTLRSFIDEEYGPWLVTNRKSGQGALERILYNFGFLLDKPLEGITAWQIEKWRTEQLKLGKRPSTVNRDTGVLRSCLSKAIEWGLVEEHPLKKLKPCRVDSQGIVRYLEPDEELRLMKALDDREARIRKGRSSGNKWREERGHALLPDLTQVAFADYLKPMIVISMNTGLRRGELFSLRWTDINFEKKLLTIRGEDAKSGRTRHVPLNKTALETLAAWKKQCAREVLVFSNNMKSFTHVKRSFARLLQDARIENFRWHDLRHHFASKLVMLGVDLYTVKDLLGHSSIKVTERYAHLAPEHKAAAVAVLDQPRNVVPFKQTEAQ